jgi:hypothetical protein
MNLRVKTRFRRWNDLELKIRKSGRHCSACGKEFDHEEAHLSMINETQDEYEREDFCLACWSQRAKGWAHNSYSFWSTRYIDPSVESEQPPEAFAPLRKVFYEALEREEKTELAVAFISAHLLRRQKVFRLMKAFDREDVEGTVQVFADKFTQRLVEVPDLEFTAAELREARQVLIERTDPPKEEDADYGREETETTDGS